MRVRERLRTTVGLQSIVLDNGPEFAGRTMEAWVYANKLTLCFIRSGKRIDNAYAELQREVSADRLNEPWFVSLADAQAQIGGGVDYNTGRPHSALDDQTPQQLAESTVAARRLPARLKGDQKPAELSV